MDKELVAVVEGFDKFGECYFGRTEMRTKFQGRPMPGYCPRRGNMKDGKPLPHRWVINRKI